MDVTVYSWYRTGRVTVINGSTQVNGTGTLWIKDGIKQGDIFILNGIICEIYDVTSNTTLILVDAYSGESTELSSYKIIPRSKQVLQAEIAAAIQESVRKHNALINEYSDAVSYISILQKMGLYIDEDGDFAQDEQLGGSDFSYIGEAETEAREKQEIQDTVEKVKGMQKLITATGIYVDDDGDVAQDATLAGTSFVDLPGDISLASEAEEDDMINEVFGN